VTFGVVMALTPCNIGSDFALIDGGVNCVRRIERKTRAEK
jgi:hypothetical protein